MAQAVAVLGAGSWGTALALQFCRNGVEVRLWGLAPEIDRLAVERENRQFLPGFPFPDNLRPLGDLAAAIAGVEEILVVVPSHAFRATLGRLRECGLGAARLSWATKGLEPRGAKLLSEVAAEELGPRSLAILSGPTFAGEVARGLPTAITAAATDPDHARQLAALLHHERFRVYTSGDIVGLQIGGAAKNVMAIGAGIADGLGFGANTRAALITRGLAEIMRLGLALGGRAETFMGLAGLGDLVLTCTDNQSRNRRMGLALAGGKGIEEARREIGQEVEGVGTTREVHRIATERGIEMPITAQIHRVLFEGLAPRVAVDALLERSRKPETD